MRRRIIVVGAMGMLGREVVSRLSCSSQLEVVGTYHSAGASDRGVGGFKNVTLSQFDATSTGDEIRALIRGAYLVVNCAVVLGGELREPTPTVVQNAFAVNSVFPKRLAPEAEREGVRVIHISSDAVFSGTSTEPRGEGDSADPADLYGMSKYLGEVESEQVLNIRTSIVGKDPTYHRGLLEWYLKQKEGTVIQGYSNHFWQGVTTRQLATLVVTLAEKEAFEECRAEAGVHHFCPNEGVSKYELLSKFERVFKRGVIVESANAEGGSVDRRLRTEFKTVQSYFRIEHGLDRALQDLLEE
jgi:dTDP-4-dehydrorhamnose reductase